MCNQAPLCVEGWDEALHEIGKHSSETVLSPENAAQLLKTVESLPLLVIGGAEDALVPIKSVQIMASKLVNSVSSPSLMMLDLCSTSLVYIIVGIEVGNA